VFESIAPTVYTQVFLISAHAKRVCSERFSALWVPIGAFGVQINQPLVALRA
jgi:hypothetical protein